MRGNIGRQFLLGQVERVPHPLHDVHRLVADALQVGVDLHDAR